MAEAGQSAAQSGGRAFLRSLPTSSDPAELRRSITELVFIADNSLRTHQAANDRLKKLEENLDAMERLVNQAVSVVTRMEQTRVSEQQSNKRILAYFGGGIMIVNLIFVVLTFFLK